MSEAVALTLIRILRRLPKTAAFDVHLTDCAALAVLYRPLDPSLPALTLSHVVRISALPNFLDSLGNSGDEWIETPVPSDNGWRGKVAPVVINRPELFKNRSQPRQQFS
jgi:hypothetical protein